MISAALLLIAAFAVVHANVGKYDLNSVHPRNEQERINFQSTIPINVVSSIGKSLPKASQLRMQSNKIDKSLTHNDKLSQMTSPGFNAQELMSTRSPMSQYPRIGEEHNLFGSQEHFTPEVTASTHFDKRESSGHHQEQFYDREQGLPNQPQFHGSRQEIPEQQTAFRNRQPEMIDQEFFGNRQTSHQPEFYSDRRQAPEPHQPIRDLPSFGNQQESSDSRQSSGQQQHYSNFQVGMNDQHTDNQRSAQDATNQKDQMYNIKRQTSFQSNGLQGNVPLDNRQQPIVFPQREILQSSSAFTSGRNPLLPILPARINGSPMTKAVAIGKGSYYQGKASIWQHLQTPFVQYVYSHLL